tara:strand:+ start:77 stop:610 length:534 start_codon:yes stop_codon:yes gene_type:complete
MILSCNSCGKKFVVPDNAITASGRMVQCGSCGNKWKQFPLKEIAEKKATSNPKPKKIQTPKTTNKINKISKPKKIKSTVVKKQREISLYSPEYLAKKHGIKINQPKQLKIDKKDKEVYFGFYNSLILFIFLIISLSRILYFAQDLIIFYFPISEFYLNYFFESIRNIFEIWKNLISY